jgi:hypothetical protein
MGKRSDTIQLLEENRVNVLGKIYFDVTQKHRQQAKLD